MNAREPFFSSTLWRFWSVLYACYSDIISHYCHKTNINHEKGTTIWPRITNRYIYKCNSSKGSLFSGLVLEIRILDAGPILTLGCESWRRKKCTRTSFGSSCTEEAKSGLTWRGPAQRFFYWVCANCTHHYTHTQMWQRHWTDLGTEHNQEFLTITLKPLIDFLCGYSHLQ